MSVAQKISNRVKFMRKGRPFLRTLFAQEGSRASVDKALCRLVSAGALERIARGVYMRPKTIQFVGAVRPCAVTVMRLITKAKGEIVEIHGAEAVRRFGLSTQMQVRPTYYTSGPTRTYKVANSSVRLLHVSHERLRYAGTKVSWALNAFHYLGKEGLTAEVIAKVWNDLSREEWTQFLACRMPAWMRSVVTSAAGRLDLE